MNGISYDTSFKKEYLLVERRKEFTKFMFQLYVY